MGECKRCTAAGGNVYRIGDPDGSTGFLVSRERPEA